MKRYFFFGFSLELLAVMALFALILLGIIALAVRRRSVPSVGRERK